MTFSWCCVAAVSLSPSAHQSLTQTATLRILIGMALVALQNFSTGLEYDQALLTGSQTNSSSSSSVGRDGGSDGGSSAADSQSPSQQPEQPSMPAEPLVGDMQLAVLFRSQKKQLLLDVIAGLADKLKKVGLLGWCMLSLLRALVWLMHSVCLSSGLCCS